MTNHQRNDQETRSMLRAALDEISEADRWWVEEATPFLGSEYANHTCTLMAAINSAQDAIEGDSPEVDMLIAQTQMAFRLGMYMMLQLPIKLEELVNETA